MIRHSIPKAKINVLRRAFMEGKFSRTKVATDLRISRNTVTNYVREFKAIRDQYPEKLQNMNFFMPVDTEKQRAKLLNSWLDKNLKSLILAEVGPKLRSNGVWEKYRALQPEGYSFSPFKKYFFLYCKTHDITLNCTRRIAYIPPEDLRLLERWRLSNDRQQWRIAVILDAAYNRISLLKTCEKVECCFKTALIWIDAYKREGMAGFKKRGYTVNEWIQLQVKEKTDNLIHLIQQSPKIYGVERVSWTTLDLAAVYSRIHGVVMSQAAVSSYMRKNNIRYHKAKEVLTSPDPLYREKFAAIQSILEHLSPIEKFFSIDEYGPFAVKAKGGRVLALPGVRPSYPQMKESKGWFVCTAALELSTNQLTHFYSKRKDTEEMIKLIDLLLRQYHDQEKIYLSWDAASWHASKRLFRHIEELNSEDHRKAHPHPLVAIAPLPSCAQFLNIIESVFSGLSKSVIHNSDYQSEDACKQAIDQYFLRRNQYYLENPKRAGNKIWGKERVKPVFNKGNICKSPYSR